MDPSQRTSDLADTSDYGSSEYGSEFTDCSDQESPSTSPAIMSLLDEARSLGLCESYIKYNPLASDLIPALSLDDLSDLTDVVQDKSLNLSLDNVIDERWDIDKATAALLASVLSIGKNEIAIEDLLDSGPSFADLKLQDTILAVDHELELCIIRQRHRIDISSRDMPFWCNDQAVNEGFEWCPPHITALDRRHDDFIDAKFQVDKATMKYLMDIAKQPDLTMEDITTLVADDAENPSLRRVTPPLLLLSSPKGLIDLRPPSEELEFTSSPEDLLALEHAALEFEIMNSDQSSPNKTRSSGTDNQNPSNSTAVDYSVPSQSSFPATSSPLKRKTLRDMRVEPPLTPQDRNESPKKKSKPSLPADINSLLPTSESEMSLLDPVAAAKSIEVTMQEVVHPMAQAAVSQAENEQLAEFDTTMRVEVPILGGAVPHSDLTILDGSHTLLLQTKRELAMHEISWSGVKKVERLLPWMPFRAAVAKIELAETLDGDDEEYAEFLEEVDPESLVAGSDCLHLLHTDESDEDELEVDQLVQISEPDVQPRTVATTIQANHHQAQDHFSLRPAGSHIQVSKELPKAASRSSTGLNMEALIKQRKDEMAKRKAPSHQQTDQNTVTDRLSGFMHTQTGTAPILMKPTVVRTTDPMAPPAIMKAPVYVPAELPLPVPSLSPVNGTLQVVVSTQMLSNRALIRGVQTLVPKMDFVERSDVREKASNESTRQQSAGADMTISPSTGLLFSTLQQIKQRPLPGQTKFFGIRDRIAAAALSHEQLIVFISQGSASSLDDRDCDALVDLTGFTETLDAKVEVRCVLGDEHVMAQWAASAITKHGASSQTLSQDESNWEHWLRVAGMNSFAAQTILSKLPQPALGTLVGMPANQRIEQFGVLLGGERVLRKVSARIDQGWISASAQ